MLGIGGTQFVIVHFLFIKHTERTLHPIREYEVTPLFSIYDCVKSIDQT